MPANSQALARWFEKWNCEEAEGLKSFPHSFSQTPAKLPQPSMGSSLLPAAKPAVAVLIPAGAFSQTLLASLGSIHRLLVCS